MDALPLPLTRDIVLIGGGHAHALVLRAWGMAPLPGARLTVINPAPSAPYTGMLPGHVAGHYGRDDLEIDLVKLAGFAGARVILGWVTGIDRAAKEIQIKGRQPLAYDVASIDIGITSDMPEIPGFDAHGVAAKPLGDYARRWQAHLSGGGGPVAVIGGGLAGVELALTMKHALPFGDALTVIEAGNALEGVGAGAKAALLAEMQARDIALVEHQAVAHVAADHLVLSDGRQIPAGLVVGAAGARPFSWLTETGLDLTAGFITVDETLRSINDPAIFAAGDCAHMRSAPRPKAGVFAVRAAPVLHENLRAAVSGGRPKNFKPQSHYLKLVSLGPKSALADKWDRAVKGPWVWRWKDRIDRKFMAKLADLPRMEPHILPKPHAVGMVEALGPKPLCGGCGAKVGPAVLDGVLANLPAPARADVDLGHGDDAAVIGFGDRKQVITTDHLRAFWADPALFARIAALHALGDIWAMGAAPQAALLQITLPPLSGEMQRRWLSEIMGAVSEVFHGEGAVIAGGHTSMGAEFSLGFSLTGLVEAPLTLAGAQPGDALVLTRPLGSGLLLAGAMEGVARGADVARLLDVLARSQGDAAGQLAGVAHAMTDVTGFGLAGHLARMAEASDLTARLDLASVPIFEGAEALAAGGLHSTLWESNRAAYAIETPETPAAELLFDPQTAGGLLASIPADQVAQMLGEISEMGHQPAVIGAMEPKGHSRVRTH